MSGLDMDDDKIRQQLFLSSVITCTVNSEPLSNWRIASVPNSKNIWIINCNATSTEHFDVSGRKLQSNDLGRSLSILYCHLIMDCVPIKSSCAWEVKSLDKIGFNVCYLLFLALALNINWFKQVQGFLCNVNIFLSQLFNHFVPSTTSSCYMSALGDIKGIFNTDKIQEWFIWVIPFSS